MRKEAKEYLDDVLPLSAVIDVKEGRFFPLVKVIVEDGQRYPSLKDELVTLILDRLRQMIPDRDIEPDRHMINGDGWTLVFKVERDSSEFK